MHEYLYSVRSSEKAAKLRKFIRQFRFIFIGLPTRSSTNKNILARLRIVRSFAVS
jgi:hypothetical protein